MVAIPHPLWNYNGIINYKTWNYNMETRRGGVVVLTGHAWASRKSRVPHTPRNTIRISHWEDRQTKVYVSIAILKTNSGNRTMYTGNTKERDLKQRTENDQRKRKREELMNVCMCVLYV